MQKKLIYRLPAPAKINRFMGIVGQRPDKMHELQTLFQFIDLCDYLNFYATEDNKVSTNLENINGSENIILKAANMLEKYKKRLGVYTGVFIDLEKNIPTGAGLGGGSSDAATTLLALNKIWNLNLSIDELAQIGLKLGADVPVFIHGVSAYAEGVGEEITPTPNIDAPQIFLLYPGKGSNTKDIFQHKDLNRHNAKITFDCQNSAHIPRFNHAFDLVKSINASVREGAKWLEEFGEVQMSGTGASIFIVLKAGVNAKAILQNMPKTFAGFSAKGFIVQAVNYSPLHDALNKK